MPDDSGTGLRDIARRRYWREADARAVVEAWRRSGKRLAEFARERGIHARRLRRWAARLEATRQNGKVTFHPVRLMDASAGSAQRSDVLEVVLGGRRTVRVPYGFAPDHLRRVLQVLEAEASC